MAGRFNPSSRPRRAGAYFNFVGIPKVVVQPAFGSIVAVPFTHDWGPVDTVVPVDSMAQFDAIYGETYSPGRLAVLQAFRGEDLDGVLGAGRVLAYRMAGTSAAKASRVLQNTTPATALTLTARYEGTKGNNFRVTVQDYAGDATKDELILFDGSTEIERYQYPNTDIADLAAQINGTTPYTIATRSDWVTAVANVTGVALTPVSSVAFTGGDSGSTLLAADWTDLMAKLEVERFSILAPFDLTDSTILASLKTWAVGQNDKGKRFIVVVGGALNELAAAAIARAATLASEHFITLGIGSVRDDLTLDATDTPVVLSTSQLAPRVAGILAQRGNTQSLTFARLRGLVILQGPTEQNILDAYDAGIVTLARDSDVDAPVRIEAGLTTYTVKTDTNKPYAIFSQPKFVRTMGDMEVALTERSQRYHIGRLPVNNKTREAIVGDAIRLLRAYEEAGAVQPAPDGWSVSLPPGQSDDNSYVDVEIGMKFGRSLEQVFYTVRVG
jgi:hypothetical protein